MAEINYTKLKFKSGLEIHQQLDTNKLFCNCPSVLRKDEADFEISRKLHAVAGESGEVDIAAQYQAGLEKEFIYQGYDTNCLVELDEEPPHNINPESLKIGLQIALLLNCKIIPVTQIMRKTVIDGSNTSGFQRTVLIARDGYVETSSGRVGIDSVCLEEDSARKVRSDDKEVVYRLDRLGIPLIEIATAPDIKSGEQAKEVALHLGEVLRSCKVRRGIGTIRQDVNISIKNENRVELKGMQDMKMFLKVIENEVFRQKKISDDGKPTNAEVRNALANGETEFIRPMPGADRMYPETDLPLLKISRDMVNQAKKTLPQLISEIEEYLRKKGLSEEMIKLLLKQRKVGEFKELYEIYENTNFLAKMILLFPKEIASKTNKSLENVEKRLEEIYGDVLRLLYKKKISEGDVKDVFLNYISGQSFKESIEIEKVDLGDVESKIAELIKSKPGLSSNAYMGLVMKEFKGAVDGKTANEIIKKLVE